MKKCIQLFTLLFIVTIAGYSCSDPSQIKIVKLGDYTPLDVQAVKLNVSDEPLIFNQCYCTGNGVVLMQLSNAALPCVYLFDYQGNLIAKGCPQGRGPNELINMDIRFFAETERGFQLFDSTHKICNVEVVADGTMKITDRKELAYKQAANYLTYLGDDKYALLAEQDGAQYHKNELCISSLDPDFETFFFGEYPTADTPDKIFLCLKKGVASIPRKRFAYFYYNFGRFRIYDYNGKMIREVGIDGEWNVTPSSDFSQLKRYFTNQTANDSHIYSMYTGDHRDPDVGTSILQWDWEGNLVGQFVLPGKFNRMSVTKDDSRLVLLNLDSDEVAMYVTKLPNTK